MREVEKFAYLSSIDNLWMDHLDAVDDLREGIGLRGYGQRDPLVEYKNEAFQMFERLVAQINSEVVRRLFRVQVGPTPQSPVPQVTNQAPTQPVIPEPTKDTGNVQDIAKAISSLAQSTPAPTGGLADIANAMGALGQVNPSAKNPLGNIGRNDPCPCGSGKKYKKCGLLNTPEHQRLMSQNS